MKLSALLLFSALFTHAQITYEIRGTVSEPGLGGIAGAEVRAYPPGAAPFLSTFTDGRGEFVVRTSTPGNYALTAVREGYGPAELNGSAVTTIDMDHPSASARLSMVRPVEIIGRVVDAETREPVEGIFVNILRKRPGLTGTDWSGASFVSRSTAPRNPEDLRTKSDGTFAIRGLMPGEYAAMPMRQEEAGSRWSTNYSPADLEVVDQKPEMRLWPGGTPKELARLVPVGSGSVVSFGDILLKTAPNYRAHVSLEQGSCPVGESMRIAVFPSPQWQLTQEAFPCGSELLLHDLEPGHYYLYAVSDWQGEREEVEKAAWATAQFSIVDKNIEVALTPQPGVVLDVQLMAADGVKDLPETFQLGVQPAEITEGFRPAPEQIIQSLPDGKYRMAVSTRPQRLAASRPAGLYVGELRYNSAPLPNLMLEVNPGSPSQKLEVVLDNRFGTLTGTLKSGNQSVSEALVLIWTEGLPAPIIVNVTNGEFQSEPLVPGEYRLIAARREDLFGVAFSPQAFKSGEKVTIQPGKDTTLHVQFSGALK